MTKEQEYILAVFREAKEAGLCKTRAAFAEMTGVGKSAMSMILNGAKGYSGKISLPLVMAWAKANGIGPSAPAETHTIKWWQKRFCTLATGVEGELGGTIESVIVTRSADGESQFKVRIKFSE